MGRQDGRARRSQAHVGRSLTLKSALSDPIAVHEQRQGNEPPGTVSMQWQQEVDRLRSVYRDRENAETRARYSPFLTYNLCAHHEREEVMFKLLRSNGVRSLSGLKILDVGCSTGSMLRRLLDFEADAGELFGVDLLERRVKTARSLSSDAQLLCSDASALPFPNRSFDLVIQSTLFTSVLGADVKKRMASEILRVMSNGAKLIWYDFRYNNPLNKDVRGIGKREIRVLFPGCKVTSRSVTLAPPIGRMVCRNSTLLYHVLGSLKFLCTHYVCLIEKITNPKSLSPN